MASKGPGGKGNVWIPNAGQGSSDRAQFADSISAEIAAERERSGKEYRPAAAHDRKAQRPAISGAAAANEFSQLCEPLTA